MKMLIGLPLLVLFFPFAETPQPPRPIPRGSILIPIEVSPVEVNRHCTHDEYAICRAVCAGQNVHPRPEPGWNPWGPITLSVMTGCGVRTISNILTLECECSNPNDRT